MRWFTCRSAAAMAATVVLAASPAARADDAAALPAPSSSAALGSQQFYVVVGAVHTDLAFPRAVFATAPPRLKAAVDQLEPGDWVAVGWGPDFFGRDKQYGLGRRAASLASRLMKPRDTSRLRLASLPAPGPAPHQEDYVGLIKVRLPEADLEQAMVRIDQTFAAGSDGGPVVTFRPPQDPNVEIFLSDEQYSMHHECNHWVAEVLRSGGIDLPRGHDMTSAELALSIRHSLSGRRSHPATSAARAELVDPAASTSP
jgi:hypothetical protein